MLSGTGQRERSVNSLVGLRKPSVQREDFVLAGAVRISFWPLAAKILQFAVTRELSVFCGFDRRFFR